MAGIKGQDLGLYANKRGRKEQVFFVAAEMSVQNVVGTLYVSCLERLTLIPSHTVLSVWFSRIFIATWQDGHGTMCSRSR